MSKYTTEVRFICESLAGLQESVGANSVDDVILNSYQQIFDNFPLYDEEHRQELCCKILKYYYTREIGEETFGLWKLRMNTVLETVMPYYNEMYASTRLEFNPLFEKDIVIETEGTFEGKDKGDNTGSSSVTDNSTNKFLDTPQNGIQDLADNHYLTNARMVNSGSQSQGTGNYNNESENKTKSKQTIRGKDSDKSYSKLLLEYRQTIVNIDKMIIEELSDCFINIF